MENSNTEDINMTTKSKDDLVTSDDDGDADHIDTRCGYTKSCKPAFLQKCAHPKMFLLVITLFTIVHGKKF